MDQTIDHIDLIGAEPVAPPVGDDPRLHARTVAVEREGEDLTLYLFGALSMNISDEVAVQAIEHIGEGAAMVTVDLAGVHFIDSTGIRALVQIHNRVNETGGRMMITRPCKSARQMLTLVHLDSVIPIGPVHDPKADDGLAPLPHADQPVPS